MSIVEKIEKYLAEGKPRQKALFHAEKEDTEAAVGDLVTHKNGEKGTIDRINTDGTYMIKCGPKAYISSAKRSDFTIRKKAYEKESQTK